LHLDFDPPAICHQFDLGLDYFPLRCFVDATAQHFIVLMFQRAQEEDTSIATKLEVDNATNTGTTYRSGLSLKIVGLSNQPRRKRVNVAFLSFIFSCKALRFHRFLW
jgi:hypothetical protein